MRPFGRRVEPGDEPRHRGLAAARLADEREGLAFGNLEGDVVHGAQNARGSRSSTRFSHGRDTSKSRLTDSRLKQVACSQQAARLVPGCEQLGPRGDNGRSAAGSAG